MRPFATPTISRVTVGDEQGRDPASYARLFRLQKRADSLPEDPDWKPITIETRGPTPWSTSASTLEYSASKNVLWRGAEFVAVASSLATQLEAGKSLAEAPGNGFPWLELVGGFGAAGLVLPTVLILRRRRF